MKTIAEQKTKFKNLDLSETTLTQFKKEIIKIMHGKKTASVLIESNSFTVIEFNININKFRFETHEHPKDRKDHELLRINPDSYKKSNIYECIDLDLTENNQAFVTIDETDNYQSITVDNISLWFGIE